GAVRAVRDRDAVGGAQAAEIPALHGAGETLADGDAGDVDLLSRNEVLGANHGAYRQEVVGADAELADHFFGFDLGARELAAHRLRLVFGFGLAGGELQRAVTVALGFARGRFAAGVFSRLLRLQRNGGAGAVLELLGVDSAAADDLATFEVEHRHRHVGAV